jgi:hypothetical protein
VILNNEYANLIGKYFEPDEENPMIGFVVLSLLQRFYRKGLNPECQKWVFNVKLMIPFVEHRRRTKGAAEMATKQLYKEKTA